MFKASLGHRTTSTRSNTITSRLSSARSRETVVHGKRKLNDTESQDGEDEAGDIEPNHDYSDDEPEDCVPAPEHSLVDLEELSVINSIDVSRTPKLDGNMEAINIEADGKAAAQWILSDGRNMSELFAEYREIAEGKDIFAKCHILEIVDVAPIRSALGDEDLWDEIETEWDAKWRDFLPSEKAKEYLASLRMSSIAEVRSVLMKPYTEHTYDIKIHYDLEYIHTVIRNLHVSLKFIFANLSED
ncbi:hypothetical protein BC936DRAFT_139019 [Jimgerdemannia flammicorona]|uniref:Uncharacterized protein n=1 Tax=Jimgerdemannia flammicorona TaxID=994334 RepID=A0A433BAT2_9FUNG|nr:hypothetical protein BC936DRAFT_139019 [Jimgerdemannia flammicorona]